jgi:hypothetical protein
MGMSITDNTMTRKWIFGDNKIAVGESWYKQGDDTRTRDSGKTAVCESVIDDSVWIHDNSKTAACESLITLGGRRVILWW